MSKEILILGGGIAGLTAGIYARKQGFGARILEKHHTPGGECTGWDRQGYHIDGCVHWLTGSKSSTPMGGVWREIGALGEDGDIHQPEAFCVSEHGGVVVTLHRDLGRLREHLTEISPDDKKEIDLLCDAVAAMSNPGMPMLPPDLMGPGDILRMMRSMSVPMKLMRTFRMPLSEYVGRFRHPAIRQALLAVLPADNCAYVLPFTLGTVCSGNGGRPKGGSRAMALRMAEYFTALGGELCLSSEVREIALGSGRASGAVLCDGREIGGDYIIPAVDIHITLKRFLGEKYHDSYVAERDAKRAAYPSPTCVYAAFAVDADLSALPEDLIFPVSPFTFEDREISVIDFKHYCYEPSFAPPGKSVAVVYLQADYDWWKNKRDRKDAYKKEKDRLGEALIGGICERFPELCGKIRLLDMATPMTYERYCGAWRGSWMSYGQTPEGKRSFHSGKIKGLDNLYMAGQWLMSTGGLPVAVMTGRWAVQRICKKEKMFWRW